ncbi:peptidase T4 [Methylobacterium sp. WL103]|uniref:P1 family peptidase n=1 Tax=Methylobacterium sp. WL103 TaxID=2603891 RepID=UPI0011C79B18|nr:P1 family peptidase [Methylobacterium sp. WL103]TXM99249.1 peptidase T4 [Methylobacterium sp. WL103]
MLRPMRNAITDIAGIRVGHAADARIASGVTALMFDRPFTASVDVRSPRRGRSPDSTTASTPSTVRSGSRRSVSRVPIVPGAILFDLLNGGDKAWGRYPPYRELGYLAAQAASEDVALGSVGAGTGARTANLKGGLGSASADIPGTGFRVGALAAVNAFGRVTVGDGPHFWAAPFERGAEFGGLGWPAAMPEGALDFPVRTLPGAATTLAVVATNAALTKAQCKRLAVAAQVGLARAIHPVHTPLDGDVVFAVATGAVPLADPIGDLARLGDMAAQVLARAIAIGVFSAAGLDGIGTPGLPPAWRDRFGAGGTRG